MIKVDGSQSCHIKEVDANGVGEGRGWAVKRPFGSALDAKCKIVNIATPIIDECEVYQDGGLLSL